LPPQVTLPPQASIPTHSTRPTTPNGQSNITTTTSTEAPPEPPANG
jgi:hypothetical protein